jgi:hypothetical protein
MSLYYPLAKVTNVCGPAQRLRDVRQAPAAQRGGAPAGRFAQRLAFGSSRRAERVTYASDELRTPVAKRERKRLIV